VRLALAALILLVGFLGGASDLLPSEDPEPVAAVEVDLDPESEQDPENEDDRDDDDDDDADARSSGHGLIACSALAPPPANEFSHPSCELDRLFRPPIA
jgi:hypothetical protein